MSERGDLTGQRSIYQDAGLTKKLVYLVLTVLLLMIGIIGLIIPVIPGLLFLAAAVFFFGKISRRFHQWSNNHPVVAKMNGKIQRMEQIDWGSRIKIGALMGLELMVSSVSHTVAFLRRQSRRFSRS